MAVTFARSSASSIVCVDRTDAPSDARFSPSSRSVVFAPAPIFLTGGAVTVLDVSGQVTVVAEPSPGAEALESSDVLLYSPFFVDDTTVAVGRLVGEPPVFEVVTFDAGSSGGQVVDTVGTLPLAGPLTTTVADGSLFASMGFLDAAPAPWEFDPSAGSVDELGVHATSDDPGDEPGRVRPWLPYGRAGDLSLAYDTEVQLPVDGPGWWLINGESSRVAVDPPTDGEFSARFAAMATDGATVAAALVDTGTSSSEFGARVFTTSTADLLRGDAEWESLDLSGEIEVEFDRSGMLSALSWEDSDQLLLRTAGGLYRFELA